jgi:hypothetical protein
VYALEVEQHAEVGNDGAGCQPNAIGWTCPFPWQDAFGGGLGQG